MIYHHFKSRTRTAVRCNDYAVSAASLVSENKTLAHPASVDSIPSSANQEDHVSMGTIASRHAHQIIQNARRVLSIEMICAMQAKNIVVLKT